MELELILTGVVVPALAAGVLGLFAWRPWRSEPGTGLCIGLVLAASYAVGHVSIGGWPPLVPNSASIWLVHLATLGVIASLATERGNTATVWSGRVLAAAGVSWILFGAHLAKASLGAAILGHGLVCGGILLWWATIAALCERVPGRPLVVAFGVVLAAMGTVFVHSHDAQAGQLVGAVGGAWSGLALVVWKWPERTSLRFAVPVLALLLAPMLAIQHTDLFGMVPRTATICLAVVPLACLVIPARRSGWWAMLPVALLCGAAIWSSWPAADPYGY